MALGAENFKNQLLKTLRLSNPTPKTLFDNI